MNPFSSYYAYNTVISRTLVTLYVYILLLYIPVILNVFFASRNYPVNLVMLLHFVLLTPVVHEVGSVSPLLIVPLG